MKMRWQNMHYVDQIPYYPSECQNNRATPDDHIVYLFIAIWISRTLVPLQFTHKIAEYRYDFNSWWDIIVLVIYEFV